MKKILAFILVVCLLCGAVVLILIGTSNRAPQTEEIYDRVVELIEGSYELNTVFYGIGLPVYETDSVYAQFAHLYYGFAYAGEYEVVKDQTDFHTVEEIKLAAEKIYSTEYLEDVLYPAAFDGYMINDGIGGSAYSSSRYLEENEWLYQSTRDDTLLTEIRYYDYSSMKVISPSTRSSCTVQIDSWLGSDPSAITKVELRLVLQDGEWYLDSFTG